MNDTERALTYMRNWQTSTPTVEEIASMIADLRGKLYEEVFSTIFPTPVDDSPDSSWSNTDNYIFLEGYRKGTDVYRADGRTPGYPTHAGIRSWYESYPNGPGFENICSAIQTAYMNGRADEEILGK